MSDALFQIISLELGRSFGLAPVSHPYRPSGGRSGGGEGGRDAGGASWPWDAPPSSLRPAPYEPGQGQRPAAHEPGRGSRPASSEPGGRAPSGSGRHAEVRVPYGQERDVDPWGLFDPSAAAKAPSSPRGPESAAPSPQPSTLPSPVAAPVAPIDPRDPWGLKAAAPGSGEASGPPAVGPGEARDPWGLRGSGPGGGPSAGPAPAGEPSARPVQAGEPSAAAPSGLPSPSAVQTPLPSIGSAPSALRFIAQVRGTYLLCEGHDGLYVLDQHAAAERVTFHRLRQQFASRQVALQPLLFPTVVEVSASEATFVEENAELVLSAGLDARAMGPTSVAVHAVPQILRRADAERLLRDLL
ncbi:MAG TPA: hypothetical protein VFS00_04805, partial [Polyangiaceae bacterium]|nr:hypothetical protein [Polyangiaceae bacterium]